MTLIAVPGLSPTSFAAGGIDLVLTASRTSGISPCGIMFSLDGSTAPGYDTHDFWRLAGCYWDFDNPSATRGTFATGDPVGDTFTTGKFWDAGGETWLESRDKNIVTGPPQAAHTFIVPDGGGSVDFTVLVNIRLPDGTTGQASIVVTVQAQDDYFSDANTIAVSADLSTGADWTVYDRPVPAGVTDKRNTMPTLDEFDGKRVMVYNNDVDSWGVNRGDFNIRMGQSNFVITYFGNDLSGTSLTDTTISFEAPSPPSDASNGDFSVPARLAGGGLIKDSGNRLGSFVVGRFIEVSGSAGQDGTYKIQEVSAGEIKIYRHVWDKLTTESAGVSMTLTEHHAKPQFGHVSLSSKDDNGAFSATNGSVSTYGWSENVTLDSLAVHQTWSGMSWQHTTLHNLDQDCNLQPGGNNGTGGNGVVDVGGNSLVQRAQYSWENATLDSSNVPLPRGFYISECVAVGNPDADLVISERATISFAAPNKVYDSANGFGEVKHNDNGNKVGHLHISGSLSNDTSISATHKILSVDSDGEMTLDTSSIVTENAGELITLTEPSRYEGGGSLFGAFNMPLVTWIACYGSSTRKAKEHTSRINGGYRIFVYGNDFEGEHGNDDDSIGPGGKHGCALRGSGNAEMGDWGDGTRTRAIVADDVWNTPNVPEDYAAVPNNRYYIQHANQAWGGEGVGNSTAIFQMSTDSTNLAQLNDCIASENYFADGGTDAGNINQRMHGVYMTSRGHRYQVTPNAGRTNDVATSSKACIEYTGGGARYDVFSCTPFYGDDSGPEVPVPTLPAAPR